MTILIGDGGPSTVIYKEVLKTDNDLATIPVIFLTIHKRKRDIPIGLNVGYVLKSEQRDGKEIEHTIDSLYKEIDKFSPVFSASGGINKIVEDSVTACALENF